MFDNLRNKTSSSDFQPEAIAQDELPRARRRRRTLDQITGMTAKQRFLLAGMLLFMVCLLGVSFLMMAGKMVPSFLF